MADASKRASHPHRRFEGLVLSSEGRSARARVRKALERAGLRGWQLTPLAPNAPFLIATPPRGKRVGTGKAWEYVYRLRADRDVDRAEPAFETVGLDGGVSAPTRASRAVRSGGGSTSHPAESGPHDWVIKRCRIDRAWTLFGTQPPGSDVVIAHPDTGYSDHPQLDGAALRPDLGFDFYAERSDPRDPLKSGSRGHGTATASIIVSATDSEVIGAAPGAALVPLRVDNDVIHFSWLELTRALYWAVAGGMPVVSMSLGGPWGGSVLRDGIAHASANGLILIAAAGNQVGSVVYPACLPEVIAVAASDVFDEPWDGSCRGPEVDITAPGASVWRARASAPGNFTVERSEGTSYATATTAGACALWLARHGGFAALAATYGVTGVAGVFKEALLVTARAPRRLGPRDDGRRHRRRGGTAAAGAAGERAGTRHPHDEPAAGGADAARAHRIVLPRARAGARAGGAALAVASRPAQAAALGRARAVRRRARVPGGNRSRAAGCDRGAAARPRAARSMRAAHESRLAGASGPLARALEP